MAPKEGNWFPEIEGPDRLEKTSLFFRNPGFENPTCDANKKIPDKYRDKLPTLSGAGFLNHQQYWSWSLVWSVVFVYVSTQDFKTWVDWRRSYHCRMFMRWSYCTVSIRLVKLRNTPIPTFSENTPSSYVFLLSGSQFWSSRNTKQ